MDTKVHSLEYRADRRTFLIAALFTILSWAVLSSSSQLEAARSGTPMNWALPWLTEFASHIALIGAALLIPIFLTKWPLSLENWRRRVPIYSGCFLIFSLVHVLSMVAIRHLTFPILLGASYDFGITNPSVWVYELRKDLMTFILLLLGFVAGRHIAQLRLEADGACSEARETGRLTLKSGGRTVFLSADEVVWAKSASNYVEIHTESGEHFVRMTLSNLENLLAEAGEGHVRTHRSYLVRNKVIREVIPTGDGDAKAVLINGVFIPVSRKYRNAITA